MEIEVTKHAVKRYRDRMFDHTSSKEAIIKYLEEIARKGTRIQTRLGKWGRCVEVKYQGVSIVVVLQTDKTVVITCLGSTNYRKWIKRQGYKFRGSLLNEGKMR